MNGTDKKGNTNKNGNIDKRKKRKRPPRAFLCLAGAGVIVLAAVMLFLAFQKRQQDGLLEQRPEGRIPRPALDVRLLTVNEYSRPGIPLRKINGIVIHYTANPNAGAAANRDYFENLKDTHLTKASSHFIIGLEGEIIQCIPSSEIAYASNSRNEDTLSIECCHEDETGKLNEKTYDSAVHLTAWLAEHFGLKVSDVIRHYDVTGKACPKYFVDHPAAWEQFLKDVQGKGLWPE